MSKYEAQMTGRVGAEAIVLDPRVVALRATAGPEYENGNCGATAGKGAHDSGVLEKRRGMFNMRLESVLCITEDGENNGR